MSPNESSLRRPLRRGLLPTSPLSPLCTYFYKVSPPLYQLLPLEDLQMFVQNVLMINGFLANPDLGYEASILPEA